MRQMMSFIGVAMLCAQMGFADVSQEITAEEAQVIQEQMQDVAASTEEADAALLVKKINPALAEETSQAAQN
jgi:hypothetical protein